MVLSPLLLPLVNLEGKTVVVIDILRATSTICAALDLGAPAVVPVVSVDDARSFTGPEYLIAGERNGETVEGFDFGNSPTEYTGDRVKGRKVVLTTTNGTKCIQASLDAEEILVGSFFNLDALCSYLVQGKNDVVLFCSGWKNRVNLEDTIFAGYVADKLRDHFNWDADEVETALDLKAQAGNNLMSYLKKASHARRFARLGNHTDLEVCLQMNQHPVVVRFENGELLVVEA